MKNIFIVVAALLSISAFADDCPNLTGKYLCPAIDEDPAYLTEYSQETVEGGLTKYTHNSEGELTSVTTDSIFRDHADEEVSGKMNAVCSHGTLVVTIQAIINNSEAGQVAAQIVMKMSKEADGSVKTESFQVVNGESSNDVEVCVPVQ